MKLPLLEKQDLKGKKVLLRLDLDVPIHDNKISDDLRIRASIPTIKYLLEKGIASLTILGHRGRPGGQEDKNLSLKPIVEHIQKILLDEIGEKATQANIVILENLRFHAGEIAPETSTQAQNYAKELAQKGNFYVNDAFGASHREQASIVLLPKLLPAAAGLHLAEEVDKLEKVLTNPKEPVVIILGGGKLDKAVLANKLLDHAEWLLVGGILPKKVKSFCRHDGHMCVSAAHLEKNGKDITPDSARSFEEIIKDAGTIVWNGPMGDIDGGHWEGTRLIAEAVAKTEAYTVVGGGDTIHALQKFKLLDKMNHISTGGGAMLEFLAYGDLPGLRALRGEP